MRKRAVLLLSALLAGVVPAGGADGPADRALVLKAARELMASSRYCALVTLAEDGRLQAREIDAFAPGEDMTVWIGTNRRTRKVDEVRRHPGVTLYYQDPKGQGYVTIQGTAAVVDDKAAKARFWKDEWKAFYEGGRESPDYVLLRVQPQRLEVVSYPHKLEGDPKTWRPVTIEF